MCAKSASPKDLTGKLVHYKGATPSPKVSDKKRPPSPSKRSALERLPAFDPLSYAVWLVVACVFGTQWVLMLGLSLF